MYGNQASVNTVYIQGILGVYNTAHLQQSWTSHNKRLSIENMISKDESSMKRQPPLTLKMVVFYDRKLVKDFTKYINFIVTFTPDGQPFNWQNGYASTKMELPEHQYRLLNKKQAHCLLVKFRDRILPKIFQPKVISILHKPISSIVHRALPVHI